MLLNKPVLFIIRIIPGSLISVTSYNCLLNSGGRGDHGPLFGGSTHDLSNEIFYKPELKSVTGVFIRGLQLIVKCNLFCNIWCEPTPLWHITSTYDRHSTPIIAEPWHTSACTCTPYREREREITIDVGYKANNHLKIPGNETNYQFLDDRMWTLSSSPYRLGR